MITNPTENKWIIRNYYEQLQANKSDNLNEMDKFLAKITIVDSRRNIKFKQTYNKLRN